MKKFIVNGNLDFECDCLPEKFEMNTSNDDITIIIKDKKIEVHLFDNNDNKAYEKAQEISDDVCKWLSLMCGITITSNMMYTKEENGNSSVKLKVNCINALILSENTLKKGLESVKNNTDLILNPENNISLALKYVSLGNLIMRNSNISSHLRYVILEYSRAVEVILKEWKKERCTIKLEEKGYDHLIEDVEWLLTIRGNNDVAHPPKKPKNNKEVTIEDAVKAREIVRKLILEETGA